MPLDHYGVAVGTLVSFTRDAQHDFGSWYHGHVTLNAGGADGSVVVWQVRFNTQRVPTDDQGHPL